MRLTNSTAGDTFWLQQTCAARNAEGFKKACICHLPGKPSPCEFKRSIPHPLSLHRVSHETQETACHVFRVFWSTEQEILSIDKWLLRPGGRVAMMGNPWAVAAAKELLLR